MKRLASLLAFAALSFVPEQASAFDCAKASTEVETAICADPALVELDGDMAEAYSALKAGFDAKNQKMLARSQKRWLAWRDGCSQAEEETPAQCIARMTGERIRQFTGEAETGPGAGGEIVPQFIVQEGTTKQYDLDIAVLRFAAPRSSAEKRFNAIADEIVQGAKVGPHGEDAGDSVYAQQDAMSIAYASPRLMSVKHAFYGSEGGAHGNGGLDNINIDMKTGKVLEIGDVISEEGAAELRTLCKSQLREEKLKRLKEGDPAYNPDTDELFKDDVIAEHVATLSRWTIREDSVTITFDPYAIGSYAEGQYACEIPMDDVRDAAVDGAPLP
jgi:uncharacterized protein